jgi:hypothetical protein
MPKFVLATAALLLRRPSPPAAAGAHDATHDARHGATHAKTRTRDATRRLRASRTHQPCVDLGPLALSRRH